MPHPEYPGQPRDHPDIKWRRTLSYGLASFGRPGRRRAALGMLLTAADLPGTGWRELSAASRRAGVGDPGGLAQRVRKTGEFTALRRFRHEDPPGGVMVEVFPLATEADAGIQVSSWPNAVIRWSGVTTLEDRTVEDIQVVGSDQVNVWESLNERDSVRGLSRKIAGRVGRIAFFVSASAAGEGWPWEDVITIASSQAQRIRSKVPSSAGP